MTRDIDGACVCVFVRVSWLPPRPFPSIIITDRKGHTDTLPVFGRCYGDFCCRLHFTVCPPISDKRTVPDPHPYLCINSFADDDFCALTYKTPEETLCVWLKRL